MRTRRVALAGAGFAALALVGAGCIDNSMPTVTGVTMSNVGTTDTVSFTFYDQVPSKATATYTGTMMPQGTGGSDRPFEIDGTTYVHVVFSAKAHDARGYGTSQGAIYAPGMASVAETALLEDYEGLVHYVIGLNTTKPPKVSLVKTAHTVQVKVTKP